MHSGINTFKGWLGDMFKENFLDFFSNGKVADPPIFSTIWKMFLSFWALGIPVAVLTNSGISDLVRKPKEDGEDKTVLTVASPIKRSDMVFAKIGAFFTFFLISNFLGFFLPIFTSYCWVGGDQGIFSTKFMFSFLILFGLVFPLLWFLLVHSILFFMNLKAGTLGNVLFAILLFFIPYIWNITMGFLGSGGLYRFMAKTRELILYKPLFVVPLCFLVGLLFFYLYWNEFTKRDFN
ncbi:hypothetical protein [endosymbiont GvMRE of Glomus versiforme]|uniref:hypothetical protein n=1 Tax=endosymbiont GvMRE of Glomus versiforme TaxID=2039283 RepID=UPI0011C34504|nr:hypothetical protein [endosymbiont GvMRE of Glomus versiforme]